MPDWLAAAAIWVGTRVWGGNPACTCVVEQAFIQPELLALLARQLERCGPSNLTVPACAACPAYPADNSLLLLSAGAVAGFSLGIAVTLLWTLLPCGGDVGHPQPAAAAGASDPPAQLAETTPSGVGRRRVPPGGIAALRDQ
jgi:hypothetical protein